MVKEGDVSLNGFGLAPLVLDGGPGTDALARGALSGGYGNTYSGLTEIGWETIT